MIVMKHYHEVVISAMDNPLEIKCPFQVVTFCFLLLPLFVVSLPLPMSHAV